MNPPEIGGQAGFTLQAGKQDYHDLFASQFPDETVKSNQPLAEEVNLISLIEFFSVLS
jgi:hypothetical protein